jgi:hypothetical protein
MTKMRFLILFWAFFASMIVYDGIWRHPDLTAIPLELAYLSLTMIAVWLLITYGPRWKHYSMVSPLARGAGFIGCGIAFWIRESQIKESHWYSISMVIIGIWEASETLLIIRGRRSLADVQRKSGGSEQENQ